MADVNDETVSESTKGKDDQTITTGYQNVGENIDRNQPIKQGDKKLKFPFTIEHLPVWLKIVYIGTLSFCVLGTGCLSRVLIHIMIWKLSPPLTNDRRLRLASIFGHLKADDELITRDSSCTDSSCSKGLPLSWTCTDIGGQTCTLAEPVPTTNAGWFWAVMLTASAPYIYTFLINLYRWCTKDTPKINYRVIIVGLIRDFLHSVALCFLVLFVLPTMSPDMASLTVFFVTSGPLVLNIYIQRVISSNQTNQIGASDTTSDSIPSKLCMKRYFIPIIAVVFFSLSFLFFIISVARSTYETEELVIETLLACIILSLEWIENFLVFKSTPEESRKDQNGESEIKDTGKKGNCISCQHIIRWMYLFASFKNEKEVCILSVIKIIILNLVLFPLLFAFMTHWKGVGMKILFVPNSNETVHYHIHSKMDVDSSSDSAYGCNSSTPYILMIICVISTFLFFMLARYACCIQYKKSGFAVPVLLNLLMTPIVLALVEWKNRSFIVSDCSVLQPLWSTDFDGNSADPWLLRFSWIFGFVSIIFFTINMLRATQTVTETTSSSFSKAAYCGLYPDVSMLLSMKTDQKLIKVLKTAIDHGGSDDSDTHLVENTLNDKKGDSTITEESQM